MSESANAFIDVRNGRAYVSRKRSTSESSWTHESCANWEALENMAAEAISETGGHMTMSGIYPCPPPLAKLAIWPETLLNMVITASEAQQQFGLSDAAVRNALKRGQVRGRKAGARAWLLLKQDAEEEWGDD